MKTARFASVVGKSGAPETYLLWVPPKQDKHFQRAIVGHRIMTIHSQNVGAKKDSATVGFLEEPNAQYLIFPKSLKRFADRKIVGINYELLAEGNGRSDRTKPKVDPEPAKPKKSESRAAKPKPETAMNVVAFATEKPATPPPPAKKKSTEAPKPKWVEANAPAALDKPAMDAAVLRELKKVIAELRAGKAVPAYERLAALVKENDG